MKVYNSNSVLIAEGYLVPNPNFISKGEYKETELDEYKRSVDFLITSMKLSSTSLLFSKKHALLSALAAMNATHILLQKKP